MISQELELILHTAFVACRSKRRAFITVEDLLLGLLDSGQVQEALRLCGANLKELRERVAESIARSTPKEDVLTDVDTKPTEAFQQVIQRAILNVQSSAKREVNPIDVLVAIIGQKGSPAHSMLKEQGVDTSKVSAYRRQERHHTSGVRDGVVQDPPVGANASDMDLKGMVDEEAEASLKKALVLGRERRHEYATVEHLLLALLDNSTATRVLRACDANIDELRANLLQHITEYTPAVAPDREVDPQPTLGFQRVMQRALLHVKSGGTKALSGADILVAIFGEKDSHANYFLYQQGVTRLRVATFIAHGMAPIPPADEQGVAGEVQVVLYDDDATPIEFVARVLQDFFGMSKEDTAETMLELYRDGAAVCGLYLREDGLVLADQIVAHAREHGHPLRCAAITPK
jgi:ATP-dependent Clp protease ATP-binding subunit ClpA